MEGEGGSCGYMECHKLAVAVTCYGEKNSTDSWAELFAGVLDC